MINYSVLIPITQSATLIGPSAIYAPVQVQQNEKENSYNTLYIDESMYIKPVKLCITDEIVSRIIDIRNLNENWDGQGAQNPDDNVISNSIKFIENLPETYIQKLKIENIEPTPYGTIVYDWDKNGDIISVEIGTMKIGFFTDFKNNNNYKVNGIQFNENELPEELISAFNILY